MSFGLSAGAVGLIGAGAGLVGSAMAADAAGDAADTQAGATRDANALTQRQYDQTRTDLAPYRNLGSRSANKLAMFLGLDDGAGGFSPLSGGTADIVSRIRAAFPDWEGQGREVTDAELLTNFEQVAPTLGSTDLAGGALSEGQRSTMQQLLQDLKAARASAANAGTAADPRQSADFGSLLKNFTGEDLQNEPGYQFGLSEGQKGVDRRLQSGGNYFSGSALKAASRFNNDYASTKFGDAFNRDSANKTRTYNFLSGTVGTGQNAAAMTGNAGQTMAQQVGANTTALGNAQGAAGIAGANAWSNGINNITGAYQQNALMDKILAGNSGWGNESWRTTGNGMPR